MKYANWYLLGWLNKPLKLFRWGRWVLSWFAKAAAAPPA